MRLIDADLLKKNCKCTGKFESNFQCVALKTLGDVIDKQPTVYDVDKVVEQLEEKCFSPHDYAGYVIDIETAIEIVKAGGMVSDMENLDVRRWEHER